MEDEIFSPTVMDIILAIQRHQLKDGSNGINTKNKGALYDRVNIVMDVLLI